ncbi:MAG: pyridoxamine 5'-phosphate oxidase family protein [Candidatus Omnitrophota bacterium]
MINKAIRELIESREFISVSTCDFDGRPNAAPKFLLKTEGNYVYLIDYVIGRTFRNMKINPRVSLSFLDSNSLTGYQINGSVEIIDRAEEHAEALKELRRKEIDLSTTRIIEGVIKGKAHRAYEIAATEQFIVLKIKVEEIVEMQPSGQLKRESVK